MSRSSREQQRGAEVVQVQSSSRGTDSEVRARTKRWAGEGLAGAGRPDLLDLVQDLADLRRIPVAVLLHEVMQHHAQG